MGTIILLAGGATWGNTETGIGVMFTLSIATVTAFAIGLVDE